jgi:hypothetical protein
MKLKFNVVNYLKNVLSYKIQLLLETFLMQCSFNEIDWENYISFSIIHANVL